MAEITRLSFNRWRVRYSAGYHNGKRRVLHKTFNGPKRDVLEWIRNLDKERATSGTADGKMAGGSGRGDPCVYALRMCIPGYENCPIKIGYSESLEKRKQGLSSVGPFPVEWLGSWRATHGRYSEAEAHDKFWRQRLVGEWFSPSDELLKYIEYQVANSEKNWIRACEIAMSDASRNATAARDAMWAGENR